ncbi:MAG: sulfotransferase [Verrucomicrobiae bacterium]|nr:sulfotransferase [Verrucomicrobiae bacterium]
MASKLKHRWSVSHNYLAGILAGDWWRLLKENHFAVDAPYWHRAAFVTAASLMNSFYQRKEERLFHDAIAETKITEPPLFILGHWRSGTTHLHNLLAQDTAQFAFANTYQVVNPHTFLCTEEVNSRRFAGLVPSKRPMDNMALSFQTPQEDEFAPCLITFRSLYLGMSFARREDDYLRYLAFREVPRAEIEEWKAGFLWFLKKLTLKYNRSLLLKSPPHTARIRYLLEMFPDARFVHIHRNPHVVFQSFRHFYDTTMWYTYLQRPDLDRVDERIIRRYNILYDAFFEDRSLIPKGHYHEMGFEDLERDPAEEVRKLYDAIGLPGFESLRPKLQRYIDSLKGYERNKFPELEAATREKVAQSWQRSFNEWGYAT